MSDNKNRAYTVEFNADVNGLQKYVAFHEGTGVLSEAQIITHRPEWQDEKAPGRLQVKDGVRALLGEYVRYWRDKGATVSEVPVSKAAALVNKLAAAALKRQEREARGDVPAPTPIIVAGTVVGHEGQSDGGQVADADAGTEPLAPHEGQGDADDEHADPDAASSDDADPDSD